MDRVTDIQMVQGLLMRQFGFWRLAIQTASSGQTSPEEILWAINKPEDVRNQLLEAHNTAVKQQKRPSCRKIHEGQYAGLPPRMARHTNHCGVCHLSYR